MLYITSDGELTQVKEDGSPIPLSKKELVDRRSSLGRHRVDFSSMTFVCLCIHARQTSKMKRVRWQRPGSPERPKKARLAPGKESTLKKNNKRRTDREREKIQQRLTLCNICIVTYTGLQIITLLHAQLTMVQEPVPGHILS